MPAASIKINTVVGSNVDLPINVLVQLDNANSGGELTYQWTILSQPAGTADVLSSTAIQNPTFTPKKEGTYLIRLIVNLGLPSEQRNQVVAAVLQLKTLQRVPAYLETTEAGNWAEPAANQSLRELDTVVADPGTIVVKLGYGAVAGQIVKLNNFAVLKSGLPGQEDILVANQALATSAGDAAQPLAIVVRPVRTSDALAINTLAVVRTYGLVTGVAVGVAGNPVYLSNAGVLAASAGTNSRQVGLYVTTTAVVFFSEAFIGGGGAPATAPVELAFNDSILGTTPLIVGSVYLGITTITTASRAMVGTQAGGIGTVRLRRNGTGVLVPNATWSFNGVGLSNVTLALAAAIAVADWYDIEIVGDLVGTTALLKGLHLAF